MDDVVLLHPGEGETMFDTPKRTIRVLSDRPELALTLFRLEPGQDGPEPHIHRRHTDAFYILQGSLELGLGPRLERLTGSAGTLAAAPPGVVHTFRNASEDTVVVLNIHAPSMDFPAMLRAARDGRDEPADFDQFEPPTGGGRPLSDALFRGPGEGEAAAVAERPVLLKAGSADAGGFFSLAEATLAPGFEGSLVHGAGDVGAVYVLEGTLSLRLAGESLEAGTGTLCLVPLGEAPAFANRSEEPCSSLLLYATPGRP
jgi:quercetin dioxygenase-like cupin family protein